MRHPGIRLSVAVLALTLGVPTLAFAASPFVDVVPGRFYEGPVQWAFDNGITTGKDATHFAPDDPVTRGETVTFLERYDDKIVQPALDAITTILGPTDDDTLAGLACRTDEKQVATSIVGSWRCRTPVLTRIFTGWDQRTVDAAGNVGRYVSIAFGPDGNPLMAYEDFTNADLRFTRCTTLDCSVTRTRTLDTATVGSGTAIIRGADGFPLIAYQEGLPGNSLRLYDCDDLDCTTGTVRQLLASVKPTSITMALGGDGLPLIAFRSGTDDALGIYHCTSADCSTGTAQTVTATSGAGESASLFVGFDGLPLIAHHDTVDDDLDLYRCTAPDCSTGRNTTLVSTGRVGAYASIAGTLFGSPVIAHQSWTLTPGPFPSVADTDLELYRCFDPACTKGANITLVGGAGRAGAHASVAIGIDGNPVVAHHDRQLGTLMAYLCSTADCSTGSPQLLDSSSFVGRFARVAVGPDGEPLIAYRDTDNGRLEMIRLRYQVLGISLR